MPKRLFEQMDNWAGGINTAANADALPPGVSPRGRNSALTAISINPPRALVSKRRGGSPALTTPLTDEPTIIGQFFFEKSDGNDYHVLVCGDGSLRKRLTDGSSAIIDAAAFTAGETNLPSFAVANDFLFITLGDEKKKFDGTTLSAFGLEALDAPTATATAGGAMATGDYDVLLTGYNEDSGHESPISTSVEVTLSGGNLSIDVDWTTPADSQITHVRVYIRQQSRGPNFYRVVAGATPAPDAGTGGFPIATLSTLLDISDTQLENFTELAPATGANVPPPDGAASPTWHRSRMFVHDGRNVYWSEIEKPESFNITNDYEPINPDDGDEIVALTSAHDVLMVFKRTGTFKIVGSDPNSWEIEEISPRVGAVNQQSIVTHGATYWWDRQQGPVAWAGEGKPVPIGVPLIGPTIDPELLNKERLQFIVAAVDDAPSRQRILWALPELGETRNTMILPFNVMLGVWESDGWDPFDVASMAVANDSVGTPWVFIGGYSGRLFQWEDATNDGVPEAAVNTGTVASATSTTITCLDEEGASPAWVVDELKELYAYAISSDGLDVQRRRITANTADTITVSPAWGSDPNDTFTFVVGGIDFQWDTPWMLGDAPFHKKRYEFLFIQASSPDSGVPVNIDVFFSYDLLNVARAVSYELLGAVVYDTAIYDRDRYASAVLDDDRIRMSKTGKAWRARIRNINPDQELTLLKVAMQSVLLTTKA